MKININKTKCLESLLLVLIFCWFTSCQKYLDKKTNDKLSEPTTLEDLQTLLNNYETMNVRYPVGGEIASDDYYVTDATYGGLNETFRSFYSWQKYDNIGGDWFVPYSIIFTTNIILESLEKINSPDTRRVDIIRGSAYFIRAFNHFSLSQLFCKSYDKESATSDIGIPLRLHSDLSIIPVRSTIEETYKSIIQDLKSSLSILPKVPSAKYLPSLPAAYGLLARVYISMSDYTYANLYADSALQLYSTLMNYNDLSLSASVPFKKFNDEVIYDAETLGSSVMIQSKAKVDTTLLSFYELNDLRKTIFFKSNSDGSKAFKGNYTGSTSSSLFTGIATDELYLIRAECEARNNNLGMALDDLNTLLFNRFKAGSFNPLLINNAKDLLDKILIERRKELLFRTLRWTDLRRLNMDPTYAQSIYRYINGQEYVLKPNSDRYTFQIDAKSVRISGLQQNP